MSTSVDDLIELKDQAVDLCRSLVNNRAIVSFLEQTDTATLRDIAAVVQQSEIYDDAEEEETATCVEDYLWRVSLKRT